MTKNIKTIVLLIVTLLVWGYSALEWINYAGASTEYSSENINQIITLSSQLKLKPKENQKLSLEYRDPFLNENKQNIISTTSINFKKPQRNIQTHHQPNLPLIEKKNIWPEIQYSGVINSTFGLLNINHKDYIVKEGEIKESISVLSINLSSIKVMFNNEIKEIQKE